MSRILCPQCKAAMDDQYEICPSCGSVVNDTAATQASPSKKRGDLSFSSILVGFLNLPALKKALVIGAVLLAAGIIAALSLRGGNAAFREVSVPSVIGMDVNEAAAVLEEGGFVVRIVDKQINEAAANEVLMQLPAAGDLAVSGSLVQLTISAGLHDVEVPDVYFMLRKDGIAILDAVGLKVDVQEMETANYAEGTILEQDLLPGSVVQTGDRICLKVARGAQEGAQEVALPDTLTMQFEIAQETLRAAGVFGVVKRYVYTDEVEPGSVVGQFPLPKERVKTASAVQLTVSAAPKMVTVPDVIRGTKDRAVAELEAYGFVVRIQTEMDPRIAEDCVIAQSLVAGARVKWGSEITLTISIGDQTEVPSVAGLTESAAVKALRDAGFPSTIIREYSENVASGRVIRQSASGSAVRGTTVTITVSRGKPPKQEAVHVHSFTGWTVTTKATCQNKGVETATCSCGEKSTRETGLAGHDWDVYAPTCTQAGYKSCKAPGCTETAPTGKPALEHNQDEFVGVKQEATCAKGKIVIMQCSVCHSNPVDVVGEKDPTKHSYPDDGSPCTGCGDTSNPNKPQGNGNGEAGGAVEP